MLLNKNRTFVQNTGDPSKFFHNKSESSGSESPGYSPGIFIYNNLAVRSRRRESLYYEKIGKKLALQEQEHEQRVEMDK